MIHEFKKVFLKLLKKKYLWEILLASVLAFTDFTIAEPLLLISLLLGIHDHYQLLLCIYDVPWPVIIDDARQLWVKDLFQVPT